jgi:hypothetical protein
MNWTIVFICENCDKIGYVGMSEADYKIYNDYKQANFLPREELMPTLFPHLPKEVVETLVTRIHPNCKEQSAN